MRLWRVKRFLWGAFAINPIRGQGDGHIDPLHFDQVSSFSVSNSDKWFRINGFGL